MFCTHVYKRLKTSLSLFIWRWYFWILLPWKASKLLWKNHWSVPWWVLSVTLLHESTDYSALAHHLLMHEYIPNCPSLASARYSTSVKKLILFNPKGLPRSCGGQSLGSRDWARFAPRLDPIDVLSSAVLSGIASMLGTAVINVCGPSTDKGTLTPIKVTTGQRWTLSGPGDPMSHPSFTPCFHLVDPMPRVVLLEHQGHMWRLPLVTRPRFSKTPARCPRREICNLDWSKQWGPNGGHSSETLVYLPLANIGLLMPDEMLDIRKLDSRCDTNVALPYARQRLDPDYPSNTTLVWQDFKVG